MAQSSPRQHTESRSMLPLRKLDRVLRNWWKGIVVGVVALYIIAWAIAPAVRAVALVRGPGGRSAPDPAQAGMPVETVRFPATDGVRLSGWLAVASPRAPTVILVHGFKGSRVAMLPWAHFLYAAGYNVLLFDDRGCGESEGWATTLGAREADDLIGAVRYLQGRADLPVKRYGAIGVSLGAGVVLLAAAREPALAAVVADSAWTDERPQLDRMATLPLGPFAVPALPYEPALVDTLIGARLEDARPLAAIPHIAPRAVLLIHSADDGNTTTPLSGERALYAAAGKPKAQWIAPSGGHAGALQAHPQEYEQQVLAFFTAHLGVSAAP
ncbi:MAG TPA: alpha/beta fold hydrolase [Ktedonobacterales bacterium]